MTKKRKKTAKSKKAKITIPRWAKITAAVAVVLIAIAAVIAAPYLTDTSDKDATLFLKKGTSNEAVADSLARFTNEHFASKVMKLINLSHGDLSTRHGAFKIKKGESALSVANHLRRGEPDEVKLLRSLLIIAGLMMSQDDMLKALNNKELCAKHDKTPDNIIGIFLPDTYQFLWDLEPEKLIEHMAKYSNNFWNDERKEKAKKLGLTPDEVVTLASIVEGETSKADEKGKVARLYLNRLQKHIKLQADPTVKFALQNFALRRITFEDCSVQSPWNTYYVEGLPPGPICIPEKASIDAVLDAPKHNYIYMCAKEDFSGYHNFAETLAEHEAFAAKYHQALREKGIRR